MGVKPGQRAALQGKLDQTFAALGHMAFTVNDQYVLMTGDDLARGNPSVLGGDADEERAQPRPNVLFEAGWAWGSTERRTVILEVGSLRGLSDLAGVHAVRTSSPEWRGALRSRLGLAGCELDDSCVTWPTAGAALEPAAA